MSSCGERVSVVKIAFLLALIFKKLNVDFDVVEDVQVVIGGQRVDDRHGTLFDVWTCSLLLLMSYPKFILFF